MTQADFLAALEQELRLRGIAFSRADLQEFVADVCPLAQENSDVALLGAGVSGIGPGERADVTALGDGKA